METEQRVEFSGTDVEAAVAAGLDALGVDKEAVEIRVLDEGSRGLLGIGARPARVQLVLRTEDTAPVAERAPSPSISAPEPVEAPDADVAAEPVQVGVEAKESVEEKDQAIDRQDELEHTAPIARQTLEELLEKMGIRARVEHYIRPAQDADDYRKLVLNVTGNDLGALIGRRGETLDALQYLTRLIVGREVERRVNLVVDVEKYRARRERSLQQLAARMAERVVATGRRQILEPMSAADRRIIHVALRDHPDVMTESIGHGENRKVTIFLRGDR